MEVQQNQRPEFPSRVVLDHKFRYEDARSFRTDDETYAEAVATTGELVRVAFTLHPLPGSSGLRVYCPKERRQYLLDTIVAAHSDAVLFRYVVDFPGLPSRRRYALDYFLYRAGSPKLSLLPRCYSTEDEIRAAAALDWRTKLRMWNWKSIGLLTHGEDFAVAELEFDQTVDSDAPLEAELFMLRSSSSSHCGQWELLHAMSRDGKSKVSFRDVLCWETHKVVPFSGYLCWVDYYRGILLCDVYHDSPGLQYVQFPVNPSGPSINGDGCPQASRTVLVTKGGTMMFITVDSSNDTCSCKRGSDFTINVRRLVETGCGEYAWEEHYRIKADDLWAMPINGYDHNKLFPRLVPEFPLVSVDEPRILYFVLCSDGADAKTWIVTLDMESNTILRCDGIGAYPFDGDAGMASYNIFCNSGFFPSEFSNYLNKLSTT